MRLTNTLTGQKEELAPRSDAVSLYVCGVTPYDDVHIGHAMSYIIFDVLRRYLEHRGYKVRHVQNFTDIDDKMIARAAQRGVAVAALAQHYVAAYFQDMDALNIQRAHLYPLATEEVPRILELIGQLVHKGYAYPARDGVYFRVQRWPQYGVLSHRTLEGMMAGARVEVDAAKEHPMDFALWKAAKPGEPSWESPWGPGRPGWHIECSAMATKYLGDSIDIHGGGPDLVFPHHENEIAQSEAASGVAPFVRYWVHHGLLQISGEKMSKSLGNMVNVKELRRRFSPDALRLFVLSSHYRSPLTFSEEGLAASERGAERLRHAAQSDVQAGFSRLDVAAYETRFHEALDDDLNTPQALAALFDLAREVNARRAAGEAVNTGAGLLRSLGGVLGLTFQPPA
ncbi:MAG: cysteine--tRNA ligase, partial [Chloroflexi bacterium]|nr:cysteine--tRNA ligase [Chloroflexota bacterium]